MKKSGFSYFYIMKKFRFTVILLPLLLLACASCGGSYDYTKHLSEIKRDIFRAETEAFTLTVCCVEREHPYASDGVTCPLTKIVEAELVAKDASGTDYSLTIPELSLGGAMSRRTVENDWFFSQSVEKFPEKSVSVTLEKDGETFELLATSVKTEATMSAEEALKIAVAHESEAIKRLTEGGVFQGEFRVRLLRRNVNYYYVGIVSKSGATISLLLGAESGEVLARRETS